MQGTSVTTISLPRMRVIRTFESAMLFLSRSYLLGSVLFVWWLSCDYPIRGRLSLSQGVDSIGAAMIWSGRCPLARRPGFFDICHESSPARGCGEPRAVFLKVIACPVPPYPRRLYNKTLPSSIGSIGVINGMIVLCRAVPLTILTIYLCCYKPGLETMNGQLNNKPI